MEDKINLNLLSKAAYINIYKTTEKPHIKDIEGFSNDLICNLEDKTSDLFYHSEFENRNKFKQAAVESLQSILALCYINNIDLNEFISMKIVNSAEK